MAVNVRVGDREQLFPEDLDREECLRLIGLLTPFVSRYPEQCVQTAMHVDEAVGSSIAD